MARGTAGLGYFPSPKIEKARGKERRKLLQQEVRAGVEETRITKMVGLAQQGAWTRWNNYERRKVTWADCWRTDFSRFKFLIQAVYDVLPSPSNLHRWGISETPTCPLCGGRGSLQHILSNCSKALIEGRYRWRHDQVLKAIAGVLSEALKNSKCQSERQGISFVKEGSRQKPKLRNRTSLLSAAPDWQIEVDLEKQMKFPSNIAETRLRPDIIFFSNMKKKIIMWELTVPWEDNMEVAHERKIAKYTNLTDKCRDNGWQASCVAIEVGCRGFAAKSLCKALASVGIAGLAKRKALKTITEAAERASKWLWIRRAVAWG